MKRGIRRIGHIHIVECRIGHFYLVRVVGRAGEGEAKGNYVEAA